MLSIAFPRKVLPLALLGLLLCNRAGAEQPADAAQRLLSARCGRCHGESVRKAGLSFASTAAMLAGGESGPAIAPGKPQESLLVEMVESGQMPPDGEGPLEGEELESIKRWIAGLTAADVEGSRALTDHDVLPTLLLHCTVCHGRTVREGSLDLRSRESMLTGGKSGPAIVPGRPQESLLLKKVHAGEMPPKTRLIEAMVKPLEPLQIEQLERWVRQGALAAPTLPDLAGTPDDPLVSPEDRQFWAFQPPRQVAPPVEAADANAIDTAANAELHSPIDAFLLEELKARGLSFSPPADKLTLLRRVTFDLTGLPPDPVEAEAFLSDQRPDAYERLVDRLLASPAYGERWGRHWLDVAGYADCEGKREQHLPRPQAWRYRDYVIRSLAADKPYDRFLTEQLAGDELYDFANAREITAEMADALAATGFLRMAPDPTWANLTGFTPDRLEVIADALDVLGSGVMGLSLKCARCHSHKFDPLPQRDYYRLAAIFKGAYDEHDWLKPEINSYGGAASIGLGERYLDYVSTHERQEWERHNGQLQQQIEQLRAGGAANEPQAAELERRLQPAPRVAALWDRGQPSPAFVYRRGDYRQAGEWVEPGPPAVLSFENHRFQVQPPWPGAASTGRRLAFARWLTARGNPLTARVIVNRLWRHHFGRGIVPSLGNFGRAGEPPTHPRLLDWLAGELENRQWSWKAIHRRMVASTAYRQQSQVPDLAAAADPDNRWLSRMPLRRLDAEALRDSLLAISGELDRSRFGPADPVSVQPDGLVRSGRRRSMYVQQLRKHPPSLLESFDLPAMNPNCLERPESLVATQALHLQNDDEVRRHSRCFAARVWQASQHAAEQVKLVHIWALGRPPNEQQQRLGEQALEEMADRWQAASHATASGSGAATAGDAAAAVEDARRRALETYCHVIINSADFLYID